MTTLQLEPCTVARQKRFSIDELGLCDAADQGGLLHITRLARQVFSATMALVGVFEEEQDRQILVSGQGMPADWEEVGWIPLSKSFSQFVRRDAAPLAVDDKDSHPMGAHLADLEALPYRSYLGAPIFGPLGEALGALCVTDTKTRHWTSKDIAVMRDLAHCVTDAILLRAALNMSQPVSYTHLTLPTTIPSCRSRWGPAR